MTICDTQIKSRIKCSLLSPYITRKIHSKKDYLGGQTRDMTKNIGKNEEKLEKIAKGKRIRKKNFGVK